MGYNAPTNDPFEVLRRQQEDAARKSRESLAAGGTQPFQSVRKLQAQIEELQAQAAAIQAQADAIQRVNDQQEVVIQDLTEKQAAIDALGLQVVRLVSGSAATGAGTTLTTSMASYAPATFTVPDGFTGASVLALSQVAIAGSWPVQMLTRIAGGDGSTMNFYPASGFANGGTSFARTLTGLSGGQQVTVETRARYEGSATPTALIVTTASVTFTKTV